ncbi:MAG: SIMPL domain-containing protein [Parahaliea sp.]
MQDQSRFGALVLGIGLVLGLSSLGYLLGKAALSVKALERTVVVKGLSEREVPANVAAWPISFQVASNDLEEVYRSIETRSAIILSFLSGYGVSAQEVTLSPPEVTDLLAQQWGEKDNIPFRYAGNAVVTVYSDNVAAVRKAMANVVGLGKQGVAISGGQGMSQFLFTGLNDLKPEMVREATENARAVAEKFAQDSNSRLGRIKSARQGQFSIEDRDTTTPFIKKVRVVSTVEYYLSD